MNGVMVFILRYFTELGSFRVAVRNDVVAKKFTFAVSSPDEFVVYACCAFVVPCVNSVSYRQLDMEHIVNRTKRLGCLMDRQADQHTRNANVGGHHEKQTK